ncbi:Serine/threonine protein kinase [hydrothermal vent metagenome]|uniref:Serine/threonine protein kinase n=1 Tax=hydrothermal vent metagenome TaxID=652676 RepID=A0A1W1D3R6_9ZZZZ
MMQTQEGKIYKKVVSKTLTNKKATSDNILDGLDWIDKEATSKDVVMIFIAGHGINDEKGNYYFLSYDANLERLRRTAVKWTEIEDTISNLPSKVILLADTCHSGNITGNRRDITSAVKSIINSGSGSIIMTATTGSGYSYEQSSWGHGAFTKSLLEGMGQEKADYDKDGIVTIKEIDLYVTNRVKQLTDGKQKPTTIIPNSVPDFAVMAK